MKKAKIALATLAFSASTTFAAFAGNPTEATDPPEKDKIEIANDDRIVNKARLEIV